MKRRQAIQSLVGISVASALPLPVSAQKQPPAQAKPETPKFDTAIADAAAEGLHRFFSAEQFATLDRLAEILMPPAADLPGAKEAGAAEFLDFLISESPADRQALYREGLDKLNAESRSRYGKPFEATNAPEIEALLAPLREPWNYSGPADPAARFLEALKLDVMDATWNSREWSLARTKRGGRARLGMYWYPIE
jgi:hypothetical protein